ncbi:MAG: polyribonucleotide nucleotidyltransferase [Microscillaceae bacterium]|nr:polyribonucleotide nucleotidyltransferase [Microscillaceae bacterium]MDW8460140.1 polyribonucleotide nucleotidyltransferase [Cytophagales bacterium]
MFKIHRKTIRFADGREILIETGKLARQADGAVVLKMGATMLLATVVSVKEAKEDIDFMPLSVDYQEKFAAAGRIPGGFSKREGKLSDYEILVSRLVDRAIRPLFPEDYHAETQINIYLISADPQIQPDALAALAASCAIAVSDIPFEAPISEVRVARIDGKYVINPPTDDLQRADLDLIVGATYDSILMVEGEMKEVPEEVMIEAIRTAHEAIKIHCLTQKELMEELGTTQKRAYSHEKNDEELQTRMKNELFDKIYEVAKAANPSKSERTKAFNALKEAFIEQLKQENAKNPDYQVPEILINRYFHKIQKEACRKLALKDKKRLDGRAFDEIRPIQCEIDYLPAAHGSALFTRGETQSLTTVTLGTKINEQMIDTAMETSSSKFMLHYNFPSFSTGEAKPNRAPGRREIGHGNLAFRALRPVMPPDEENPYTIRVVSDILESNGSSSMATVCAGALALMDAGIPIKAPVAGIAMGLIFDEETKEYAVLSDILGDEDHLGNMDFKVAGTAKGITACQMDIKLSGLSYEILSQALEQAKKGRLHILDVMNQTIAQPRPDLKPHAPRSLIMRIDRDYIGAVIGPGGKVIQEIQRATGATITIEEKDNAGWVNIFATSQAAMQKAEKWIKGIITEPELGNIYEGKVKSITPFGAFVEFLPGREGLLHISDVKWEKLPTLEGILEVGEEVTVKLVEIDKKAGKFRLSRKVLIPKPESGRKLQNNSHGSSKRRK